MKLENIKFKAKRLDDCEWIEGDLVHTDTGAVIMEIDNDTYDVIDPSTVCQFTGLKDCEGNEVWEGDVLDGEFECEIVFTKGTFATRFINYSGNVVINPLYYFERKDGMLDCKVIGNKFDKEK